MASFLLGCFVVASPMLVGAGSGFLQHSPGQTMTPDQMSAVLAAIEDALGDKHRQATELRAAPLAEMLAPTLSALPKNEYGKFGHKATRYALHRLFVQRHAWIVTGLQVEQNLSNATPTEMLKEGVPEQVQSLFESRLGSHGLSAHEVAVMAATFENLVHQESMERLRLAYSLNGISPGATNLTADAADELLDVYTALYVTKLLDLAELAKKQEPARLIKLYAQNVYPGYTDLRSFVRKLRNESTSGRTILSSIDVAHVVTRFGDKYGRWQNHECEDLKRKLLSLEDDGTGRISLSKFYNGAINHGHWQFVESTQFLRSMGALDETNPANPRVIIANYVLAPSNCVASSNYYSVCCLDECEDLVDHIEREIQAPTAAATRIAELVTAMPSSTTRGNHTIPPHLLVRLDEIAAANNGKIILHGRMFAQWMHHLYPRECPFPHLSGSISTKPDEFKDKSKIVASEAVMRQCIADATGVEESSELSWSGEDEMYVEHTTLLTEAGEPTLLWGIARFIVFFLLVLSMVSTLLGFGRMANSQTRGEAFSKVYV